MTISKFNRVLGDYLWIYILVHLYIILYYKENVTCLRAQSITILQNDIASDKYKKVQIPN